MEKNWITEGKVTPVKSQIPLGSCNAHAYVAAVESKYLIENNLTLDDSIELSEAELYLCGISTEVLTLGIATKDAITLLRRKGIALETMFPYASIDEGRTCTVNTLRVNNSYIAKRYIHLTTPAEIKAWVTSKSPVPVSITIYSDFSNGTEDSWAGGIYHKASGATIVSAHAVLIVGFSDEGQYWICKNSWGTNWRDAGYFKIGYGEASIDNDGYGIEDIVPYVFRPSFLYRVVSESRLTTSVVIYVIANSAGYTLSSEATWITAGLSFPITDSGRVTLTITQNTDAKARLATINLLNHGNIVSTMILKQAGTYL